MTNAAQSFIDEPEHVGLLRDTLKRFVAEKAPREKRRDWDKAHQFPRDVFAELAKLGICGLTIPEAHGGAGVDLMAAVAAIEELAQAGAFLAGPFIHAAFYGGANVAENGSDAQKAEMLPKLAAGEMFFAYGLSEPDVGGDLPNVKTRARMEGDEIVINGAKRWCTGADFADVIYCLVNSDPDGKKYKNLSVVLVPVSAPGITMQPIEHANLRYTLSSDVYFDDVRVPASCVLGGPDMWNRGWGQLAGRTLDVEKIEITAVAYGLARAAVEEAWQYAQEREQFGRVISGHQSVRHALVDAKTKLQACRHMLYHAVWLAQEGRPCSVETSMAKLFIGDTAVEIALICQRVMGAYALSDGYDMERHVRDILGMPIVGGSSNMQRNNIAARLGLPE
ncbi:acyl-CoA dehydrogenase family protein [Pyruvatibacter mobilis]|uniref:acyl-CoA dehydrogenase family protein n=1 Tax=Pyruvatibacter mobilis TaxID=1712261 RepID=UPI003C79E71A